MAKQSEPEFLTNGACVSFYSEQFRGYLEGENLQYVKYETNRLASAFFYSLPYLKS